MKRIFVFLTFTMICFALLLSCRSKRTLHLYSWADYFAPELIEAFEKRYDCRVVYDTFDSNEELIAKLQAGARGYDIIVPSHYVVDLLAKNGKLEKLDTEKLTCVSHYDSEIVEKMQPSILEYSALFSMSYTGIGYNKKRVENFQPSWTMFERTNLNKRATLLDDKREVIAAALATEELDLNSYDPADLEKAGKRIKAWMKNITKFENEQYKNGLSSDEFFLVMGYSGDIGQIMEDNSNIGFVVPKEGSLMSCDMLAIPTSAKDKELAYAFINFIHEPENAAKNTEEVCYLVPNRDAYPLLSEDARNNPTIFPDQEALKRCAFTKDLGENEVGLNRLWENIKANR